MNTPKQTSETLVFDVTVDEDGRYVAQARGDGIATDGSSCEELKASSGPDRVLLRRWHRAEFGQAAVGGRTRGSVKTPRDVSIERFIRYLVKY
jgi:hypothetical protein